MTASDTVGTVDTVDTVETVDSDADQEDGVPRVSTRGVGEFGEQPTSILHIEELEDLIDISLI